MVEIDSLEVKYNGVKAVSIKKPISFNKGDRIGIIGSNGSGKTSFINGLLNLTPSKGKFKVGVPMDKVSVHMQYNHYPNTMPVKHVIETVLCSKIENNKKATELIEFFDFKSSLNKKFKSLSGGQKQRLTLIMVLSQDNPLVFFDEVTSGLDFTTRQRLVELLYEWYEGTDTTICFVSHYYEEIEYLVNKVLYMEEGEIVDFGDKQELFNKYCCRNIIVFARTEKNEELANEFIKLEAPEHLIALKCIDKEMEKRITDKLIDNNVDYKRSSIDIEIMSVNAKEDWLKRKGGSENYDNN